jgi:hypothetical protein
MALLAERLEILHGKGLVWGISQSSHMIDLYRRDDCGRFYMGTEWIITQRVRSYKHHSESFPSSRIAYFYCLFKLWDRHSRLIFDGIVTQAHWGLSIMQWAMLRWTGRQL